MIVYAVIACCIVGVAVLTAVASWREPAPLVYDWERDRVLAQLFIDAEQADEAWDRYFNESALLRVIGKREVKLWTG